MGRESKRIRDLREELRKLMAEQLESLRAQTFGGIDEEEMRNQDARLKRIREVSADFLSALKQERL